MTSSKSSSRANNLARGVIAFSFFAALPACSSPSSLPPELSVPLVIRAVGRDFAWRFIYPGVDGKFDTSDDIARDELYVPANHHVMLELSSEDYVYIFRAPDLNLRKVAIPELQFTLEFTPQVPGRHKLEVDPLCALLPYHEDAMGYLVVASEREVQTWLAK